MKKLYFLIFLIWGCSPRVIVNTIDSRNSYAKTEDYESFALIENKEWKASDEDELLANIEIMDNGLSIDCSYDIVRNIAEQHARELGGNCLHITEHILPDFRSTCHRIKARVYRLPRPEQFEKFILWHQKRPLKIANYRGSVEKRPFQAATYTSINYYITTSSEKGKLDLHIESVFNSELSYFKKSKMDSFILAHEQLHFDITEIYARKLRKNLIEEVGDYDELLKVHESIYSGIVMQWDKKQDEYDSEVYSNRASQEKWNAWVETEMRNLDNFKSTIIQLDKK